MFSSFFFNYERVHSRVRVDYLKWCARIVVKATYIGISQRSRVLETRPGGKYFDSGINRRRTGGARGLDSRERRLVTKGSAVWSFETNYLLWNQDYDRRRSRDNWNKYFPTPPRVVHNSWAKLTNLCVIPRTPYAAQPNAASQTCVRHKQKQ